MEKTLLPLGSIVYLKEGTHKVMIVGRGVVYDDKSTESEVYTDYMGCQIPYGIDPNRTIFFNKENIDAVVFTGYSDENETRYMQVYQEWEKNLKIPRKEL